MAMTIMIGERIMPSPALFIREMTNPMAPRDASKIAIPLPVQYKTFPTRAIMDCRSFYRCAFHHSRAASLALNCCSGGLQPQAKITRCKSLSLEFAESKLRLSPVRANPTAFVHKLRALPNDRAILRKDEGINEQAIKFQPDGLFDSSFVVGVTVTTQ